MRRLTDYDKLWIETNLDKLQELWFAEHFGRSEDSEQDKTLRECMRSPFREHFQLVAGYVIALGYKACINYNTGEFYIIRVDEYGIEKANQKYYERNFEDWREE